MAPTTHRWRHTGAHPTRLLCRLWGHRLDAEASYHYGVDYCERCAREVTGTGLREWLKTQAWVLRWRTASLAAPLIGGWRRCPDCQRRFTRCDESVEHIPF